MQPDAEVRLPADTAYVAVHTFEGMAFEPYFRAVEELMRWYRQQQQPPPGDEQQAGNSPTQ